jgi:hypothetical protein
LVTLDIGYKSPYNRENNNQQMNNKLLPKLKHRNGKPTSAKKLRPIEKFLMERRDVAFRVGGFKVAAWLVNVSDLTSIRIPVK